MGFAGYHSMLLSLCTAGMMCRTCFKNTLDVGKSLLTLLLHAARHELAGGMVHADLAAEKDQGAGDLDAL